MIKKIIIHIILPLILGVLVYVLFRKNTIFSNDIFYIKSPFYFSKFIKNHLSDCFWAYSLTSCILLFTPIKTIVVCIISLFFVLIMEVITSRYFYQTFDWLDVIFMSFSCIVACLFVKKNNFIDK